MLRGSVVGEATEKQWRNKELLIYLEPDNETHVEVFPQSELLFTVLSDLVFSTAWKFTRKGVETPADIRASTSNASTLCQPFMRLRVV